MSRRLKPAFAEHCLVFGTSLIILDLCRNPYSLTRQESVRILQDISIDFTNTALELFDKIVYVRFIGLNVLSAGLHGPQNHADWFLDEMAPHGSSLESSRNPPVDLFLP